MKKILCLFPLYLIIQGCFHRHEIFSQNNLTAIEITLVNYHDSDQRAWGVITNKDSLKWIISTLNNGKTEPIDFLTRVELNILYSDGRENRLYINGSAMKYEGRTYRLKQDMRTIIAF